MSSYTEDFHYDLPLHAEDKVWLFSPLYSIVVPTDSSLMFKGSKKSRDWLYAFESVVDTLSSIEGVTVIVMCDYDPHILSIMKQITKEVDNDNFGYIVSADPIYNKYSDYMYEVLRSKMTMSDDVVPLYFGAQMKSLGVDNYQNSDYDYNFAQRNKLLAHVPTDVFTMRSSLMSRIPGTTNYILLLGSQGSLMNEDINTFSRHFRYHYYNGKINNLRCENTVIVNTIPTSEDRLKIIRWCVENNLEVAILWYKHTPCMSCSYSKNVNVAYSSHFEPLTEEEQHYVYYRY